MGNLQSQRQRMDEELYAILLEAGTWVVYGTHGQSLSLAPSLRTAIEKASNFTRRGAVVIAVAQHPAEEIVVFPPQMRRVERLIMMREMTSVAAQ